MSERYGPCVRCRGQGSTTSVQAEEVLETVSEATEKPFGEDGPERRVVEMRIRRTYLRSECSRCMGTGFEGGICQS